MADRQAVALRDESWTSDVASIIESLSDAGGVASHASGVPSAPLVFIGFAAPDRHIAGTLAAGLEALGFRLWVSEANLRPGQPFAEAIADALRACDALLVILSPDSIRSEWVLRELQVATELQKQIIPLAIDNTVPSGPMTWLLAGLQTIQASRSPDQEVFRRVADALTSATAGLGIGPPPLSARGAEMARALSSALGEHGQLAQVPLDEFEGRLVTVMSSLVSTPLTLSDTAVCLQSGEPAYRLLGYCQLQVRPEPDMLPLLLAAGTRERTYARSNCETRPLWNFLESLHRHREKVPDGDLSSMREAAQQLLEFLERNDDLDRGRQCRRSVSALLELL